MSFKQDIQSHFPNEPKSAPVPLYYRIKEYLNNLMVSGEFRIGEQIPTEEQLSQSFQVSRMTARRAVDELVREGRLIRRQGVGTFVAEPVIGRQLTRLSTLTEEMEQLGYKRLNNRILAWHTYRAQRTLAGTLGIQVGELVLRIKRVRYTGDIPIALQTIYMPEKMALEVQPPDLDTRSFYQILEEQFNRRIEWGRQQIDAVAANSFCAKWLEVAPGGPLFKVTRHVFWEGGQPLDIVKTYYRPDRYSFKVNLYRDQG